MASRNLFQRLSVFSGSPLGHFAICCLDVPHLKVDQSQSCKSAFSQLEINRAKVLRRKCIGFEDFFVILLLNDKKGSEESRAEEQLFLQVITFLECS